MQTAVTTTSSARHSAVSNRRTLTRTETTKSGVILLIPLLVAAGCGGGANGDGGATDMALPPGLVLDLTAPMVGDMAHPTLDLVVVSVCDPLAQNCAGADTKCTVIQNGNGMLASHCEPVMGENAVDQPCMRTTDGGAPGFDDCQRGAFCSSAGSINATVSARHCRAFCVTDTDCKAANSKCIAVTNSDGICVPTCTPFDAATCPMDFECSVVSSDADGLNAYPTCRSVGATAQGQPCSNITDCVSNTRCIDAKNDGKFTCVAICDMSHACPAGATCRPIMGIPNKGGICH